MNILYILSGTNEKGGASKSFMAMIDSIASAGHKVAVVAPDEKGIVPLLRDRGYEVMVTPYMHCTLPPLDLNPVNALMFVPRCIKRGLLNIRAMFRTLGFAKAFKPDIVHENTSVTDIGHYVAKTIGVPHVIHVREYGWEDFKLRLPWLSRRLKAPNAYLVAITEDLARHRGKGLPENHVRTIYNGIVRSSDMKSRQGKTPCFLYAGRIERPKGIQDLIDAYVSYATDEKRYGRPPFNLKIAGGVVDEALCNGLKDKLEVNGLSGNVEWLGAVDGMEDLYSRAAATVIPSLHEGFGRVMPEAMAAGSLCIVRNAGGLSEQLENGRKSTGKEIAFYFENVKELADRLREVSGHLSERDGALTYDEECRAMARNAQATVMGLYTCEANGENIVDYYQYIVANK